MKADDLLERASQSIKVKRYSEALEDLNAAIEAVPALSEAYSRRASILRELCRLLFFWNAVLSLFVIHL